jgi:hypothetical protein
MASTIDSEGRDESFQWVFVDPASLSEDDWEHVQHKDAQLSAAAAALARPSQSSSSKPLSDRVVIVSKLMADVPPIPFTQNFPHDLEGLITDYLVDMSPIERFCATPEGFYDLACDEQILKKAICVPKFMPKDLNLGARAVIQRTLRNLEHNYLCAKVKMQNRIQDIKIKDFNDVKDAALEMHRVSWQPIIDTIGKDLAFFNQRLNKYFRGKLDLSGLGLTSLALSCLMSQICNLTDLQELDLSSNKLTVLPAEMGFLKNLRKLKLADNQFKSFPLVISKIKNLEKLEISREAARLFSAAQGCEGVDASFIINLIRKNPKLEILFEI